MVRLGLDPLSIFYIIPVIGHYLYLRHVPPLLTVKGRESVPRFPAGVSSQLQPYGLTLAAIVVCAFAPGGAVLRSMLPETVIGPLRKYRPRHCRSRYWSRYRCCLTQRPQASV